MANEDVLKRIEERLTRLEATLAQAPATGAGGAFIPPGGAVVDPAPWPGCYPQYPYPRWPWPHPIVDPGPWPRPVVDPVPWPHPIADPAPNWNVLNLAAIAQARASAIGRIPVGPIGDPPPLDISRLTVTQLEASLHSIAAEKARLNGMETMIKQQLEKLKQQG